MVSVFVYSDYCCYILTIFYASQTNKLNILTFGNLMMMAEVTWWSKIQVTVVSLQHILAADIMLTSEVLVGGTFIILLAPPHLIIPPHHDSISIFVLFFSNQHAPPPRGQGQRHHAGNTLTRCLRLVQGRGGFTILLAPL